MSSTTVYLHFTVVLTAERTVAENSAP